MKFGTAAALGLAAWVAAAGCSEFTTLTCTDRGCLSGLAVRLEAPLPDGATVSLVLGDAPWTVTCGEDVICSDFLFFENLRADHLTIRVRTPSRDDSWAFAPEYGVSKPNGPDCPGECFYAEVTLPAGTSGTAVTGTGESMPERVERTREHVTLSPVPDSDHVPLVTPTEDTFDEVVEPSARPWYGVTPSPEILARLSTHS